MTTQTIRSVLWVMLGGGLGAGARYLSLVGMVALAGIGFPWGTMAVNIAGSFLMGLLAELGALAWQPSPEIKLFLTTGILGGFTTFSTFSLDVALLVERNDWIGATFYLAGSVVVSIAALFAAMALVRQLV